MHLDHPALVVRERARLVQDLVGDSDLADVVQQEAVLEAGIVEQASLDSLRKRERIVLDALSAGADGAIAALANLAPASSAAIREAWIGGSLEEARRLQRLIAPLGEALSRGYGLPGLKAGLRMLGYDHGDPRPPLAALDAANLDALRRLLADAQVMPRALAS